MRNAAGLLGMLLLLVMAVLAGVGLTRLTRHRVPTRAGSAWSVPALEKTAVVRAHILAREAIASRVIEKETSLFEAAALFRRLNEEAGYQQKRYWEKLPGDSLDEKACRQVITWVSRRLEEVNTPASQTEAIVGALEVELEEHLSENGRVILSVHEQ